MGANGYFQPTATLDTHQVSKPSNRRGTRQRSNQQAQQVLRQALVEEIKTEETAAAVQLAPAEGAKEAAWISRRKSRMFPSHQQAPARINVETQ